MIRCARCSSEMSVLTVFCSHCQHPNEPDFKQLINKVLGDRFQLYRQLSEGGLSTVFAAIDIQTDRTVVVKVSDPRHLTQTKFNSAAELSEARQYWAEMTERMQREVTALVNIHDPNIVKVFAAGSISPDLSYVVMELLRGKTLREELNSRGPLPVKEAVSIALEVASGLSTIHSRSIVHRDLTPRNIFLCSPDETGAGKLKEQEIAQPQNTFAFSPYFPSTSKNLSTFGSVKLIDFGIAKFPKPADAQTYTQHAVMAGTPGYASPEQFQNLAIDHRADIYSLGVVLYEMVTGQKPFAGRTATEIALKQLSSEPLRPRALNPELPIRLEALILRAIAKDPSIRQQSAEELVNELKAISSRVEIPVAASVLTPMPALIQSEPSSSDVFAVLSNLTPKINQEASGKAENNFPEINNEGENHVQREPNFEIPQQSRSYTKFLAAAILLIFGVATWLFARANSDSLSALQTALPELTSSVPPATPTPSIRPDVTAPHNNSHPSQNHKAEENQVANNAPATPGNTQPSQIQIHSQISNDKIVNTHQPAKGSSTSQTTAIRNVTIPPPIQIKVEPTPTPAPAPIQSEPKIARNNDNEWKRDPAPPVKKRSEEIVKATPPPQILEPKVISWQGRVQGFREVTLEMPGVPGMVDIPRNFRKKVGIIEPPSPGNGWKRAVLRVFGNGEVSLIIRWLPHNFINHRQELVRWEATN